MSKYERKSPRIVAELLSEIASGRRKQGEQFLTIAQLAEQYSVSHNTASGIIKQLKTLGALSGRPGGKTWVRIAPKQALRRNTRYHQEKRDVHAQETDRAERGVAEYDSGTSVKELHELNAVFSIIDPPQDIADIFGLAPGAKVLKRLYTRRHAENAGMSGSTSYLPYELVSRNPDLLDASKEPWPGGTMHQLWTIGVELGEIEDRVTVDMPTAEEAADFDIPPGVPIIRLRKISFAVTGEPVEIADIPLPGDRIELVYNTPLERWPSE
ncbi:GntR family transcriptional regulator [Kitasatospora sp. NPDC051170]|uniref:GntR family transcriptional regulator n=1 Tax=Kitasatospora sp. NPDC051170 TaxID=3364056 RepID=UPI0037A6F14D